MSKYLKHIQRLIMTYMIQDRKWRRMVNAMAMVVVFVTTYALILPAITLEKEKGKSEQGVYLDQIESGSTASMEQESSMAESDQDTEGKDSLPYGDVEEKLTSSDSTGEDKESVPTEKGEEDQQDQISYLLL